MGEGNEEAEAAAAAAPEQPGEEHQQSDPENVSDAGEQSTEPEADLSQDLSQAEDNDARLRQLLAEYGTHRPGSPKGKDNHAALWEALQSEGWTRERMGSASTSSYYFPAGVTRKNGFRSEASMTKDNPRDPAGEPIYYAGLGGAVRHLRQTGWRGYEYTPSSSSSEEEAAEACDEDQAAPVSEENVGGDADAHEEGDDDRDARLCQVLTEYGTSHPTTMKGVEYSTAIWEALETEGWRKTARVLNLAILRAGPAARWAEDLAP